MFMPVGRQSWLLGVCFARASQRLVEQTVDALVSLGENGVQLSFDQKQGDEVILPFKQVGVRVVQENRIAPRCTKESTTWYVIQWAVNARRRFRSSRSVRPTRCVLIEGRKEVSREVLRPPSDVFPFHDCAPVDHEYKGGVFSLLRKRHCGVSVTDMLLGLCHWRFVHCRVIAASPGQKCIRHRGH